MPSFIMFLVSYTVLMTRKKNKANKDKTLRQICQSVNDGEIAADDRPTSSSIQGAHPYGEVETPNAEHFRVIFLVLIINRFDISK